MNAAILHLPSAHPFHRLSDALRARIVAAQTNQLDVAFSSAGDLCRTVCDDLKVAIRLPSSLDAQPASTFADRAHAALVDLFLTICRDNGVPAQALRAQADGIAHRVQLVRAFDRPDAVIAETCDKIIRIVGDFPTDAAGVQCGRNPGDVLDPYILAAAQSLVFAGSFEATVAASVTHKILMMVEGLLGHLHEDVIGAMRGNVRAPEPRGEDQETLDPIGNPFPGADIVQPPTPDRPSIRFHQVKSKTGSAKGGDGARLGRQLAALRHLYGGDAYYDALIGNTLRGHRSMQGVLREAPEVIVLVGDAAFRELTGSSNGAQLLLKLYQSAFDVAAHRAGYDVQKVVADVYAIFKARADEHRESYLETVLRDAVAGDASQQDSRHFVGTRRGRKA